MARMNIGKWIGFLFSVTLVALTCACTSQKTPVPSSTTASSLNGIISTEIWKNLGEEQSDIHIMYGYPGILGIANNVNATYEQVNAFFAQSVPYMKSIPKSGTKPYKESAGYLGPPVLTISNKQHKVIINPAWYVETPGGGNFKVQHVSGVLEINVDGHSTFIQSKAFYDWMYNEKWKSSFHN